MGNGGNFSPETPLNKENCKRKKNKRNFLKGYIKFVYIFPSLSKVLTFLGRDVKLKKFILKNSLL